MNQPFTGPELIGHYRALTAEITALADKASAGAMPVAGQYDDAVRRAKVFSRECCRFINNTDDNEVCEFFAHDETLSLAVERLQVASQGAWKRILLPLTKEQRHALIQGKPQP